jgi:hypothetical protein
MLKSSSALGSDLATTEDITRTVLIIIGRTMATPTIGLIGTVGTVITVIIATMTGIN